jgi:hypothetical protein
MAQTMNTRNKEAKIINDAWEKANAEVVKDNKNECIYECGSLEKWEKWAHNMRLYDDWKKTIEAGVSKWELKNKLLTRKVVSEFEEGFKLFGIFKTKYCHFDDRVKTRMYIVEDDSYSWEVIAKINDIKKACVDNGLNKKSFKNKKEWMTYLIKNL